jgi:hypothetical protein
MSAVIQVDVDAAEKALNEFHCRMWASLPAVERQPHEGDAEWRHYAADQMPDKLAREERRLAEAYHNALHGIRPASA